MASKIHCITPALAIECWYLSTFEESFGLPDGEFVLVYQAYDPITNAPCGPRGGDTNPAYVRLWMAEKHPAARECQIVAIPTVTQWAVQQ